MICETFPEKHYNKLADIWSFGITLIEMAEEKPPYAEMNPAKVIFKVSLIPLFLSKSSKSKISLLIAEKS